MRNSEKWIINWFEENSNADNDEIQSNLNENYFTLGWIDSLKFLSFIDDLEEQFDLEFSNNDFQNRDFATVKGLAEILEKKLSNEN